MKKAFLKSANRKPGAPAEQAEGSGSEDEQPAAEQQAPPSPKKAPAALAAAADNGGGADGDGDEGPETRGRMVQRHKREAVALKKRAKGGKAEAAKAAADLDARHAKELADLERGDREAGGSGAVPGPPPSSSKAAAAAKPAAAKAAPAAAAASAAEPAASAADVDGASKYLKDATLGDDADADDEDPAVSGRKQSKAQKRREKAAAKESARDARIAAERAALGPSERAEEGAALARLLRPLGLALKDVRADGNCMYHSVADQLEQHPASSCSAAAAVDAGEGEGGAGDDAAAAAAAAFDHLSLRRLAAAHMRRHRAEFEPFVAEVAAAALPRGRAGEVAGEEEEEGEKGEASAPPADAFEAYVGAVEGEGAWGGHVELSALAGALRRRIRVVAAGMPEVWAGEEHGGEALTVCYVRHEFGLGEHYNSVRPREEGEEEGDEEEGEEEEAGEEAGGGGGGGASDGDGGNE